MKSKHYHLFLLLLVLAVLVWSGIKPVDRGDWWLEIMPFLLAAPFLFGTYRRFRLSDLMYTLIAVHAIILAYGGHTTYALAPLGFSMERWFGWSRNNYDKIGHLAQGMFPYVYVRELIARTSPLTRGKWLAFVSISVPLALSAVYEIIEWQVAIRSSVGEAFLGTQGYVWDTQSDMLMCGIGAMGGWILLTKWHNRSMEAIAPT
ncbi:MAG: DUF2238 domain-containing protein [Deltaproteobacteria bacterium]